MYLHTEDLLPSLPLFWSAFQILPISAFIYIHRFPSLSHFHYPFHSISIWFCLSLCVLRNTALPFYIYIVVHIDPLVSLPFHTFFVTSFPSHYSMYIVNVDDCRYYYPLSVHICFCLVVQIFFAAR